MANRPAGRRPARSTSTAVGDGSTTVPGEIDPALADPAGVLGDPDATAPVTDPGPGAEQAPGSQDDPVTGAAAGPQHTEQAPGMSAADLAARRRAAMDTSPAPHPPGAPASAVAGAPPQAILASRTLLDGYTTDGSPGRPDGPTWQGHPLVLQNAPFASGGSQPVNSRYVIAEFSCQSSTVMPGTATPVNRTEWKAGQLVRRDAYEAVLAEHEGRAAGGTAHVSSPAAMPDGVDRIPPDVVATGPGAGVYTDTNPAGGVKLSAPTAADRVQP